MSRILVIDDDHLVRFTIRTALEQAGHAVVEAEDGARGLSAFDAGPFDLVITDLLMPEKEGVETVREIRQRSSAVKILAVSGGGMMKMLDYLTMAEAFGADRSLAKPFTSRQLVQIVSELLAPPTP
jgi:DNA-binding response OmpR family regulator